MRRLSLVLLLVALMVPGVSSASPGSRGGHARSVRHGQRALIGAISPPVSDQGLAASATRRVVPTVSRGSGQVVVTKKQYGKRWPFTVPRGILRCHGLGGGVGEVMFVMPGVRVYAVNGVARMLLHLPKIDPIWRKDPLIPGARVDISPILDRGLKLCA
jgi:hypothetical protein